VNTTDWKQETPESVRICRQAGIRLSGTIKGRAVFPFSHALQQDVAARR
jgi:hypothetical protein